MKRRQLGFKVFRKSCSPQGLPAGGGIRATRHRDGRKSPVINNNNSVDAGVDGDFVGGKCCHDNGKGGGEINALCKDGETVYTNGYGRPTRLDVDVEEWIPEVMIRIHRAQSRPSRY